MTWADSLNATCLGETALAEPVNHIAFVPKKSSNPEQDDRDCENVRSYCQQLGYKHAVFVRLIVGPVEPDMARAESVYA